MGSIPGQVIPKTLKMVFDASLLNTQYYKVWIKGKWSNARKGVALSPTPWCSSYIKASLLGYPQLQSSNLQQLIYIYIYIYIYISNVPIFIELMTVGIIFPETCFLVVHGFI